MIGLAFLKLLDSKLSIYYNRSLRYAIIHHDVVIVNLRLMHELALE